jgi:glyoxylase-like metal-dependent hydrolase (beta-lactamase superfamily II)
VSSDSWITPGAHEVVNGVYRIPLPLPQDGLKAVNVYVVAGEDSLVCIDSGWDLPEARSMFVDALASLECGPADIAHFLVTHIHRDHYTQAVALRRDFSMQVSLGERERSSLDAIRNPDRPPFENRLEQLRSYGANGLAVWLEGQQGDDSGASEAEWGLPDRWLTDGEVVRVGSRALDVVETPGHTQGHVVFHDREASLLFAGDHVLPTITPSIGFEPVSTPNPLGAFLGSLARVRSLPDAMLLPAHGPVVPSVHDRVDELVAHHGTRLEQSLAAVAVGADIVFEVARQLPWTRRERKFEELDHFNQVLAVGETGAHLALLEAQGRLRRTLEDGTFRYALP